MTAAVESDFVDNSYQRHIQHNVRCPPFSQGDKVKPLTLSNLGSLFVVVFLISLILSCVKIYSRVKRRKRPKLPMRPISNSGSQDTKTQFEHPMPHHDRVSSHFSLAFANPLLNRFIPSHHDNHSIKCPV